MLELDVGWSQWVRLLRDQGFIRAVRRSAGGKVMNTDKSGEKRGVTAAREGCVLAPSSDTKTTREKVAGKEEDANVGCSLS